MDYREYEQTAGYLEAAKAELAMVVGMSDSELEDYAGDTKDKAIAYIMDDIVRFSTALKEYEEIMN